jgi:GlpG protein
MRKIADFTDKDKARRFSDYLLTLGIKNNIDPAGENWEIWVHNEDQLDSARREADAFSKNPEHRVYDGAHQESQAIRRQETDQERRYQKNYTDVGRRFHQAKGGRGNFTVILVAVCVVVFFLTGFGDQINPVTVKLLFSSPLKMTPPVSWELYKDISQGRAGETLTHAWRQWSAIRQGEFWRLVSPCFIHWGFIHVYFNMWWLLSLGSMIENRKGALFLLVLVVVSGVVSNTAQYFAAGPLGGGFSGVLYALFGYIWMKSRFQPADGLMLRKDIVIMMLVWLFVCMTGVVGPIGNTAHTVGLLVGMVFGATPALMARRRH